MKGARQIGLVLGSAAGFLLLVAVINFTVAPYHIYCQSGCVHDEPKPKAYNQAYLNKRQLLTLQEADTALIGNSRVLWGLHAGSEVWEDSKVINLGIPAISLTTFDKLIDRLLIQQPGLERVVLGIDYIDLYRELRHPDAELVFSVDELQVEDIAATLFGLSALMDSGVTLISNQANSETINRWGDEPRLDYPDLIRAKGQSAIFDEMIAEARKVLSVEPDPKVVRTQVNRLFEILEKLRSAGVDVYIVFYPFHSSYYSLLQEMGRFEHYAGLKSEICTEVSALDWSPDHVIEVWDFGYANRYTNEVVPDNRDEIMEWYWDPGHFRSSLGDVVIGNILRQRSDMGRRCGGATQN